MVTSWAHETPKEQLMFPLMRVAFIEDLLHLRLCIFSFSIFVGSWSHDEALVEEDASYVDNTVFIFNWIGSVTEYSSD